ncbi:uncharacterized protein BJ171DRAFT_117388 [Polychytrium aggregatum]|uniref:uncharacterized protein n=1 Tax=Polychytrium aggregatum TaxID=110093 RepID=UPI0022FDB350|nr:uncharacterized protein BJ171DRAFT_117388 [Polychytrium aggregatum]KAI9209425.1 hypothetical protein BJ171DRAFT_117388 [Polychytrium aggregatum]
MTPCYSRPLSRPASSRSESYRASIKKYLARVEQMGGELTIGSLNGLASAFSTIRQLASNLYRLLRLFKTMSTLETKVKYEADPSQPLFDVDAPEQHHDFRANGDMDQLNPGLPEGEVLSQADSDGSLEMGEADEHDNDNDNDSDDDSPVAFIEANEVIPVYKAQARNAYAVNVLRRVRAKLDGIEGEYSKMDVSEHVNLIVQQATNVDNLALMYEGWMGWI